MGGTPAAFLDSTFLLTGRERFVEFAIDQEIAQDATGAPGDAVSPPLDTRGVLLVDEDATAADKLGPLSVVGAAGDVVEDTGKAGLE